LGFVGAKPLDNGEVRRCRVRSRLCGSGERGDPRRLHAMDGAVCRPVGAADACDAFAGRASGCFCFSAPAALRCETR